MLISVYWKPTSASEREHELHDMLLDVEFRFKDVPVSDLVDEAQDALTEADTPTPFHWPIEFPEIFSKNSGFSAIIGNPPFVGGRRMRATLGDRIVDWLSMSWPHASMNADYCSFFFLRASQLLNEKGNFGLLATKTIGQGDTARTGLGYLTKSFGMAIYAARNSFVWPGTASVVASLVVAHNGEWNGQRSLDGRLVDAISEVLDDEGGWGEAKPLPGNKVRSFQGSVLVGMGFVLSEQEATELVASRPHNAAVIHPYLSGDDLNTNLQQKASRWAIDFRDYSLSRCESEWPELIARIRTLVKPQRDNVRRDAHRRNWWHHGDKRPALYSTIAGLESVFVVGRVTKYVAVCSVPTEQVFHEKTYIFDLDGWAHFCTLQSSFHDVWVRRGSSTVGETLNYTASDYFDTYPFSHIAGDALELIGEGYHECRRQLMDERSMGLTEVYNLFHSDDMSVEVRHLRSLHAEMDHALATAYGWDDLDLGHDFHPTKQGVRYTISEAARREVLQRLLKLNHERYEEEIAQGIQVKRKGKAKAKAGRKKKAAAQPSLFPTDEN